MNTKLKIFSSFIVLLFVSVLFLSVFFVEENLFAASCGVYDSSQGVPDGYGASYNYFSPSRETIMNVDCQSNDNVNFSIGNGEPLPTRAFEGTNRNTLEGDIFLQVNSVKHEYFTLGDDSNTNQINFHHYAVKYPMGTFFNYYLG